MKLLKSNQIFQRIEKKYLMDQEQFKEFQKGVSQYMKVDEYGLHTICNIYYDTENFELVRRSIDKPQYKEKLRVRSYGIPGNDSATFVEIKKKYSGVVYKRRIQMPLSQSRAYVNERKKTEDESQIQREIDYFLDFYHPVPKMYIAYDRTALFDPEDDTLRITFDQRIRTRDYDLDLALGDHGELLLPEEMVLMEIKVAGAYPLWMTHLLTRLSIYPVSFSKYGSIYQQKYTMDPFDLSASGQVHLPQVPVVAMQLA